MLGVTPVFWFDPPGFAEGIYWEVVNILHFMQVFLVSGVECEQDSRYQDWE